VAKQEHPRAKCRHCNAEIFFNLFGNKKLGRAVWRHVGSNQFTCAFTPSDYKGAGWPTAIPKE